MSASPNPYQGFGYYSGLTQALAGQLRGEAEARRIQRAQQQAAQEMAFRQQQAQMVQIRFQAQQAQQQARMDMEAKQSADRAAAARQDREASRRMQEERLKMDRERLDITKSRADKANQGKGLTPMQQLTIQKQYQPARNELDQAWNDVTNTPGDGTADGPVTFTLRGKKVTMPRSKAMDNIQKASDTLEGIYGKYVNGGYEQPEAAAQAPRAQAARPAAATPRPAAGKKPAAPAAAPAKPISVPPEVEKILTKRRAGKALTRADLAVLTQFSQSQAPAAAAPAETVPSGVSEYRAWRAKQKKEGGWGLGDLFD
jgi:hypothetical protein